MRRVARTDANQASIVEALRKAGATVQVLSAVGDGCPDILIGIRGKNILAEIKDPKRQHGGYAVRDTRRALTGDQIYWHQFWNGQVAVVWDEEEALELLGVGQKPVADF